MFSFVGIVVLIAATAASSLGTVALKYAALTSNPVLSIAGALLWASAAMGFVFLSRTAELSTLAIITSAAGILLIQVAAVTLFAEPISMHRLVALALLILAMVLLHEPPNGS